MGQQKRYDEKRRRQFCRAYFELVGRQKLPHSSFEFVFFHNASPPRDVVKFLVIIPLTMHINHLVSEMD